MQDTYVIQKYTLYSQALYFGNSNFIPSESKLIEILAEFLDENVVWEFIFIHDSSWLNDEKSILHDDTSSILI